MDRQPHRCRAAAGCGTLRYGTLRMLLCSAVTVIVRVTHHEKPIAVDSSNQDCISKHLSPAREYITHEPCVSGHHLHMPYSSMPSIHGLRRMCRLSDLPRQGPETSS
eukprot:4160138-Prymnesium_polylepis.2